MTSLIASFVPVLHIADGYHQPYHREMYTGRHDWLIQRHNTVSYTCSSPSSSSVSETSGSRIETHYPEKDDDTSTSQGNCTSSLGTSRYAADDESTARSTKTAEIVYTKKGYLDRYRDRVSYESDFESDSEEDYRDDRQLQTLSPAD